MSLESVKSGRVAVLLGGNSAEREVSLESGAAVLDGLNSAGFDAFPVDPVNDGWLAEVQGADFAFIALHGPGGEDGSLQGALEIMGIPYSGSGVLGSSLALDKVRSKQVWQALQLPTAKYEILSHDTDWQGVIDRLGSVFVKPVCEGSSIGMAFANTDAALRDAYKQASTFVGGVMAEQFIDGPEYTVAVLGSTALPSIRLETDNTFYDYDAKYVSNETRYYCPSDLNEAQETELAQLCLCAFDALDCAVWGRVDVMRHSDGCFYLLEANTVPGMTSHSLVPMAAARAGMDISALVSRIVALSLGEAA